MIKKNSRIYVAGHKGLVGSSILRKLKDRGYKKIITETKSKLDLTDQLKVLINQFTTKQIIPTTKFNNFEINKCSKKIKIY